MSDNTRTISTAGAPLKQQSRLKWRAPPSLHIACPSSSHWNVAIPLLSPLATSLTLPEGGMPVPGGPQDDYLLPCDKPDQIKFRPLLSRFDSIEHFSVRWSN
ncbi:hypothetical protein SAY86_008012 [Trapa natans]|uniref:Uncharacterized protein n=1 Tax=Trapa natans TaxID=22666 RepID=A0AAN7LID8_TRANT|nr:hypothetical protein SAY86_008012 [Trapa natans]